MGRWENKCEAIGSRHWTNGVPLIDMDEVKGEQALERLLEFRFWTC